ncbi:MAG: hypothetical protein HC790_08520 [Acaryochloridaceae cyanobacterium CSU_3_4]|nr:hypothetical protein [Acaryochloridaceae cyanobacterium CSU_3_4]
MSLHLSLFKFTQHSRAYSDKDLSIGRRWHQYRWQDLNHRFVLEPAPDPSLYYMTTQKSGVAPGDYIEISGFGNSTHYQIVQLEFYCDPPDMWMATLQKITQTLSYGQPRIAK